MYRHRGCLLTLTILSILFAVCLSDQYSRHGPYNRGYNPKDPRLQGSQRDTYPRIHPCEGRSCYPASGNLLVGRVNQLSVTSTCGVKHPERFCIVSQIEDQKKCFFCDATGRKGEPHGIENVVSGSRKMSWWQAENGVENVTIRADLGHEFHVTHLIFRFKTFRPAAMLIERSYDDGKTWNVYRYFAYNCEQSFPGIPTGPPVKLTDVICETKYSQIEPSTLGEIIFRVLSRNLQITNPYSNEVQDLLRVTNLRINFTKLHTLGDDLLDNRAEIREKYYYAIRDMVIGGFCSCYGHASRCLSADNERDVEGMVHGLCECTHNTTGKNCKQCKDFYHDLPWKPAYGKQTNACRRCNCNEHSDSCHFDEKLYERSGRVSGGVCDNCQHNTMGTNCEHCKPFFYHDSSRDITDPEACQPCNCDLVGSVNDICESRSDPLSGQESGKCQCKANVDGRRCDRCKVGYWNFTSSNPDGCQECTCNILGTLDNQGCIVSTGECNCKQNVQGRDCDKCAYGFWGLSADRDGCKPCDCALGGSYDRSCDALTGQCKCRAHVGGRTCDTPEQNYFTSSLDYVTIEAEDDELVNGGPVVLREPYRNGQNTTWTGTGFRRVYAGTSLDFIVTDLQKSMFYDIIVRYEPVERGVWEDVDIFIKRHEPVDADGPCYRWHPEDDHLHVPLLYHEISSNASHSVCLEEGKDYTIQLHFNNFNGQTDTPSASVLIDSIVIIPRIDMIREDKVAELQLAEFRKQNCYEYYKTVGDKRDNTDFQNCNKIFDGISFYIYDGAQPCDCNPTGSLSLVCDRYGGKCQCKPNVGGRTCDRCTSGTYGFGPDGCKQCDCNSVGALDNFCDVETGRCKCRDNTYGRTCGDCEPGFWDFPYCKRCECNGHADSCDQVTGACIDCRDSTTGHNCDRCIDTYYGDPRLDVDIACRPCPCPGTIDSGHSYAKSCTLDPNTNDVICECAEGYAGSRCNTCADNYFGNPEVSGGKCEPCDCSGNIDMRRSGNCDPQTGECLQCLHNTAGFRCHYCKADYYGSALLNDCRECNCDMLGTDLSGVSCDHRTGKCPCLPHVIGDDCSACEENHWKIASGEGCELCDCDVVGSRSARCDIFTGMCDCKEGFGGRKCNECQANYWGNPNVKCYPCDCDPYGSKHQQCDPVTGMCVCREGQGGDKCDQCARNFTGVAPNCQACGECFNNWDDIINDLKSRTIMTIAEADRIKRVGTTGVYTKEFNDMIDSLNEVDAIIKGTSEKSQDLDSYDILAKTLDANLTESAMILKNITGQLETVSERVAVADGRLKGRKASTDALHKKALALKNNAMKLQEANVQGALNLTHQMAEKSTKAEMAVEETTSTLAEAKRFMEHTENVMKEYRDKIENEQRKNRDSLDLIEKELSTFGNYMPNLNLQLCGQNVSGCSDVCGGAGCGFCGGLSCGSGAIPKAENALDHAKRQSETIKNYKDKSDELLHTMNEIGMNASEARSNVQSAFNAATIAQNISGELRNKLTGVTEEMWTLLNVDHTTPAMVRDVASSILKMDIKLTRKQIEDLATEIKKKVTTSHTDPEKILKATENDSRKVSALLDYAKRVNVSASDREVRVDRVRGLLQDTQNAQVFAEDSISRAEQDIDSSSQDLDEISQIIKQARQTSTEAMEAVDLLNNRLNDLKINSQNSVITVESIQNEADTVSVHAESIRDKAEELGKEYQAADQNLEQRVNKSKEDIQRAKRLLQLASELMSDTQGKLKDLERMESVYIANESKLNNLTNAVDMLDEEMQDHLRYIKEKEEYYRMCQETK